MKVSNQGRDSLIKADHACLLTFPNNTTTQILYTQFCSVLHTCFGSLLQPSSGRNTASQKTVKKSGGQISPHTRCAKQKTRNCPKGSHAASNVVHTPKNSQLILQPGNTGLRDVFLYIYIATYPEDHCTLFEKTGNSKKQGAIWHPTARSYSAKT